MSSIPQWLSAFPIQPASLAVESLLRAWSELSRKPVPKFDPAALEPQLTKRLKIYVETVTAPAIGLLGSWSAESVIGRLDLNTLQLIEERRTDITFHWNDATQTIQVVFEFKRMSKSLSHREAYIGDRGLGRFVSGRYAADQTIAAMVGVLLDPHPDVVPPLQKSLEASPTVAALRLRPAVKGYCHAPPIFGGAEFDTEHDRGVAGSTGTPIRVSHFFVAFGYPTGTSRRSKRR